MLRHVLAGIAGAVMSAVVGFGGFAVGQHTAMPETVAAAALLYRSEAAQAAQVVQRAQQQLNAMQKQAADTAEYWARYTAK